MSLLENLYKNKLGKEIYDCFNSMQTQLLNSMQTFLTHLTASPQYRFFMKKYNTVSWTAFSTHPFPTEKAKGDKNLNVYISLFIFSKEINELNSNIL